MGVRDSNNLAGGGPSDGKPEYVNGFSNTIILLAYPELTAKTKLAALFAYTWADEVGGGGRKRRGRGRRKEKKEEEM